MRKELGEARDTYPANIIPSTTPTSREKMLQTSSHQRSNPVLKGKKKQKIGQLLDFST